MSRVTVRSAVVRGIEAVPVYVEVAVTEGIPGFHIVGMVDAAVLEAKERVCCAIKSAGFTFPDKRVLVNLAPSSLRKRGSGFDLAIAVGILAATEQIDPAIAEDALVFGELMLSGNVIGEDRGFAAYVQLADANDWAVMCGRCQTATDWMAHRVCYRCIADLSELREWARECGALKLTEPETAKRDWDDDFALNGIDNAIRDTISNRTSLLILTNDFGDVAKRVSHWTRKAEPLEGAERDEVEVIASCVCEQLPANSKGGMARPFRAPHHSVTMAGLIGGGNPVMPGEATLAHNGVLFLEGAEYFNPGALDALKEVRDGMAARIVRADGSYEMPADFALIATAKPCPCGNYGNPDVECTCPARTVMEYQRRVRDLGRGLFSEVIR